MVEIIAVEIVDHRPGRGVMVYCGMVDLGTGVLTALTQIVVEELDLPRSHVAVIQGDTALTPDQGTNFGSFSIHNGGG